MLSSMRHRCLLAPKLAWWAGMNGVIPLQWEGQGIGLIKFIPTVTRLAFDVHTDNVETCLLIATGGATSTAEKVKKLELTHGLPTV